MMPLAWIGARARFVLAFGVVAALVVPGPGTLLDGTIPFWVALLTGLAMTRIDLAGVARRALGPRRLARSLGFLALLMLATPALFWALGRAAGLGEAHLAALVLTAAAPPLGSATAFCLILRLNAAFALEMTVLGAFLTPFTMPGVARALLGEAVPLDAAEMLLRLGTLIGAAAVGAVAVRLALGASRIERHRLSFDGLSSLCLILFLFPLFDGLTDQIAAAPLFAALTLLLVLLANLGTQVAVFPVARRAAGRDTGGAAALIWGNRNAALALAALPPDPVMTLYVALYQFPMYFTPLIMRPVVGDAEPAVAPPGPSHFRH